MMRVVHQCVREMSSVVGRRRVVVTGMGLVSCLGVGVEHVWQKVLAGKCGIGKLKGKGFEGLPCRVGGLVPRGEEPGQLKLEPFVTTAEQRSMSLATAYAIVATDEAIKQAGWQPKTDEEQCRAGVAVGMGMVGLEDVVDTGQALAERGYKRVNPFFVPRILVNMAAGNISLRYGLKGPNHSASTACTTAVHAIGDAMRFITYGDADLMVCGGTEASVNPLAIAGFARCRALSTHYNQRPLESSRPFDGDRDGFVMSEGAGILVLEELEHALSRGARIIGEVRGYGLSGDSHHITAPPSDGNGAYRCMAAATRDAGLAPGDMGYVNAHATSTPLGDIAETRAIARLLPDPTKFAVSSTKGALGHLLGAAGSAEAIMTLKACVTGELPPTINCHNPDEECGLNYVPLVSQPWPGAGRHLVSESVPNRLRVALNNSFGFGGTNASLCLSNWIE